ncbi:MAG: TIM barrel protein [Phycisphaerae bacterium]
MLLTAELVARLDAFKVELPSWGFADTGTRFGKFYQPAAAQNLAEKLADAGMVHRLTGACPTIALHVLWDLGPQQSPAQVVALAAAHGMRVGSLSPNLFQAQNYKWGSLTNRDPAIRTQALAHVQDSVALARACGSDSVSLWLADGMNYPGQADIATRKRLLTKALQTAHGMLDPNMTLLVEYKPFEPAFYATDIADWGMALLLAQAAGPQAKVLVDTGHHYASTNIEQIVAWLLDENRLGGFHFNDRKYADDDLTMGSIDPYQVFRIFHEIENHRFRTGETPAIAYMIDQSHNLKPKMEAMVQTVVTAQELYLKACLVDRKALAQAQAREDLVASEEIVRGAFYTDVRPMLADYRSQRQLPADPLAALRASGYIATVGAERTRLHPPKSDGGYA